MLGAPWQRCTVHFLRDLRGHVRRDQHDALGAIIRQIFTASDGDEARRRLRDAVDQLERRLPKIAALLEDAEPDVLAFYAFPAEHWPKIRSTDESVKGSRGGAEAVCEGSDRSGEVLAGAQIGFCGPRFGVGRQERAGFGHAAASPSVAARSARRSAGVRLRCGRGRPPSEAQDLGLVLPRSCCPV